MLRHRDNEMTTSSSSLFRRKRELNGDGDARVVMSELVYFYFRMRIVLIILLAVFKGHRQDQLPQGSESWPSVRAPYQKHNCEEYGEVLV
jgi:hypothetical protein